jgi:hypothetical protein
MYGETTPVEQEKSVAGIIPLALLKSFIHLSDGEDSGIEAVGK